MKNVLIFMLKFSAGGAERQLVKTAHFLKATCNVSFVAFSEEGYFKEIIDNEGFPIIIIKRSGNWKTSRILRNVIKEKRIDVVLSYLPECNIISELATLPVKQWRVVTGARSANPGYVTNPKLKLYYLAHHFADAVISNSETNKKDILKVAKLLPQNRIHVIYNMLDTISVESAYLPFKNGKINIVVAANFRKVKNLIGLLKALLLLSEEERSQLHIDWYGLEIDDTKTLGMNFVIENKLGDVVALYPSTDKVLECYNRADVVGLFSHYEGLPNSLCEALVLGKTVITTPVSDMPALLNGTQNIVCQSDSVEDISEGLRELIKMEKRILVQGELNKNKYSKLFETSAVQKQLNEALNL